jgi:hypothetical protein
MAIRQAGNEGAVTSRMSRRKWLKSLVIGGSIAVFGGAVAVVRTGGYPLDPGTLAKLRILSPWQYILVRDLARRLVAPDRSEGVPTSDEVGVAQFVDGYLAEMRPLLRRDVFSMLRFVEQLAPLGSGLLSRFTELSATDQDRVLSALEASHIDQLRAGFQATKALIMMGYYRHPKTFAILGYRGPLISPQETGAP